MQRKKIFISICKRQSPEWIRDKRICILLCAQPMQWLDNIRPTSSRYASGQLARAQLRAQSGKIDDARALLARLQSSDPLPSTQLLIARIDSALLLATQRYTEAEARLAQAYKIWPDAPELI